MKTLNDYVLERFPEIMKEWSDRKSINAIRGDLDLNKEPFANILLRNEYISKSLALTLTRNSDKLKEAQHYLAKWMEHREYVRIIGAGRALIAGSLAGNRLAHGGAIVSFVGGMVPMAHSSKGGGIIACSASGKTESVLSVLQQTQAKNLSRDKKDQISIIGIAKADALEFARLCTTFIGIHKPDNSNYPRPLSALADLEELIIAELLDGLVCYAGHSIGYNDTHWGMGHEDLGPTGPYDPEKKA